MQFIASFAFRKICRSVLVARASEWEQHTRPFYCYHSAYLNRMSSFTTSTLLCLQTGSSVETKSSSSSSPSSDTEDNNVNNKSNEDQTLETSHVAHSSPSSSSSSSESSSSQLITSYDKMKYATPAATPGGVDLSEVYTHDIAELEHRRRTVTRASDEQRRGVEPLADRYKNTLHTEEQEIEEETQYNENKKNKKYMELEEQSTENDVSDSNKSTSNVVSQAMSNKSMERSDKKSNTLSASERWWSYSERDDDAMNMETEMYHGRVGREMKRYDGMFVPELTEVLRQDKPEEISLASELYGKPDELTEGRSSSNTCGSSDSKEQRKPQKSFPILEFVDETPNRTRHPKKPLTFDPTLDNTDELLESGKSDNDLEATGYIDYETIIEINKAAEADQARLDALGNPLTVEDQLNALIAPSRHDTMAIMERKEFNGFNHWGLLHRANTLLSQELEFAKARMCVNQYMRDMDLFVKWLEHPKVIAHIEKKFKTSQRIKYDRNMGMVISFYMLGKIAVYEDNAAEALKSFHNAIAIIHERGNLSIERHRRAYGYNLLARGAIYCKLQSYERAEDDLTRCIAFMQAHKFPIIYELRAEVREQLGNIDGAREDEEKAAELWEKGEVICDPVTGEMRKLVN